MSIRAELQVAVLRLVRERRTWNKPVAPSITSHLGASGLAGTGRRYEDRWTSATLGSARCSAT